MSASSRYFHEPLLWILSIMLLLVGYLQFSTKEKENSGDRDQALQSESPKPDSNAGQRAPLTLQTTAGLARTMTREDPAKAARWLQTFGDAPGLDEARVEFLREAGTRDHEIALEQVETLSSQDQRDHFYGRILRSWAREDRESAISWAKENVVMLPRQVYRDIVSGS